jgi:di/tricarboxylate transporter
VALLATIAMTMAARYQISPLLIAIMVVTGANAGAFSPFAPTGVIASGLMDDIGLDSGTLGWVVFGAAAVLQSLTALGAYSIYLARRHRREVVAAHAGSAATRKPPVKRRDVPASSGMVLAGSGLLLADAGAGHGSPTLLPPRVSGPMNAPEPAAALPASMTRAQWATLGLIALMIGGVVLFDAPLVLMACVVVAIMSFADLGDFERVMRDLPWGTILMVTGIALLIGLMEKTGGLDLATTLIASVTRPEFINAALAFITGVVSAFSSSSGVVMPAFIPLVPSLAEKMGIVDSVVKMVISVCVGSHMVDVSPLSTLGALALAAIPIKAQRDKAFRGLLIWGMSMAVVGAVLAFVFLDLL